jgi:tRNA-guanine family transglycosylase
LLYSINKETKEVEELKITRSEYRDDKTPLNKGSNLEELRNTTRAYLNYLFRIKDPNSLRIATLLNLESYNKL